MIITLTEKPAEDGSGETTWEVGMMANLPKDSTQVEQAKWDKGAIGLVLMNSGFGLMSQSYRETKASLALAAAEKEEAEKPKIILPGQGRLPPGANFQG